MQKFDYESECDRYQEQLFDYVSDILTEDERAAIELHIGSCQRCAKELEEIRAILGAAAALAEPEVPEDLRTAVSERLLREERVASLKKRRIMRAAQIAVPFAACAALAIGIYSGGLYDRYMNADDMVTTGITENSAQTDDTDLADTEEVTLQPNENDADDANAPAQSRQQTLSDSKPENENENIKSKAADIAEATPAESNDASVPESTQAEDAPVAEEAPPAVEEAADASVPAPASIEEAEIQSFRARIIEEDTIADEYGAEKAFTTDSDTASEADTGGGAASSSATYSTASSGSAAGGGSSQAATARAKRSNTPPARCTVTVDDPAAFAAELGKELTNGTITLSESEWDDFIEYVRNSGAQLDASYSEEYNGQTIVTVNK